jgi:hypothetical protein
MKKINQICEEISQQYAIRKDKKYPLLNVHTQNDLPSESYSCKYAGGNINITGKSPLGTLHGLNHISIGIASGHYAEYLGDWHPRFPWRPLWLGCDSDIILSPRLEISIPSILSCNNNKLDLFCRRILDLGYNSVLFGNNDQLTSKSDRPANHLKEICAILHDYGLKVILKPNYKVPNKCPMDPIYKESLQQALSEILKIIPNVDCIFWQGDVFSPESYQHPSASDATQIELVQADVSLIETALQGKASLIYYIPAQDHFMAAQQSKWLPSLCDEVGDKTILAFSAVAGNPCSDHLSEHPFWETLRKCPDVSATPLMPIVNIGSVRQGEGFWPVFTFDLIERYFSRCYRHPFAGIMTMVNQLPAKGSLMECNLWVASQAQWKNRSVNLLAETWFRAKRPDLEFLRFEGALKRLREIVIDLSLLRSLNNEQHRERSSLDEYRALADSLLANLRHLQIIFESNEIKKAIKTEKPTWLDYYTIFARDAKRLIFHFVQNFHVSLPHVRKEDDPLDGFWTKAQPHRNNSIFLEQPQRGPNNSKMAMIYDESRMS